MGGHTGGKLGSGSLTQRLAQALSSKILGKKSRKTKIVIISIGIYSGF